MSNKLYIPATENQKKEVTKIKKVGGLTKANKAIKDSTKAGEPGEHIYSKSPTRE